MFDLIKNFLINFFHHILKLKISTIKEYLPMIIIIPTLLGGIWQAIELWSLGMPYIRFFSTSQLIPDGLIIIFMIIVLYIYISGSADFYTPISFKDDLTKSKKYLFL